MLIIILIVVVLIVAFVPPLRHWLLEELKELSDRVCFSFSKRPPALDANLRKTAKSSKSCGASSA